MTWRHERDLARRALDTARTRGATYADVRFVRRTTEESLVKNGRIESVDRGERVPVLHLGSFSFTGVTAH